MNWRRSFTFLFWLSGGLASLGLLTVAVGQEAGATENATRPRLLVDFRDARTVKLRPMQAQAVYMPRDGGHALKYALRLTSGPKSQAFKNAR